ncbi:MAG: flagellar motor switch phosphatase FliY [Clostridia bacterium]|nr:flagellar motor switch phosphatase FliY [Clostridia bacterium]
MADTISQDEINALFANAGGGDAGASSDGGTTGAASGASLTDSDRDVLGEVGNISMGSAATTLSSLLNEKVNITTPTVKEGSTLKELLGGADKYVAIDIKYKTGLDGSFMLLMKEQDVKIVASMMMGQGPNVEAGSELDDMSLSAIAEAMNQMVGTSCTSMSQVFSSTVDINPPSVEKIDISQSKVVAGVDIESEDYVTVEFDLTVGDILASKMVQILPRPVAKQLIDKLTGANGGGEEKKEEVPAPEAAPAPAPAAAPMPEAAPAQAAAPVQVSAPAPAPVSNASSVQFETLVAERVEGVKEQISLIQDVPLEVVVELGRTNKSIKEILEFSPGVVIELNKMAGEPIDILINNKFIAKGEVVVIDENFGIRITEIIDVKKRI